MVSKTIKQQKLRVEIAWSNHAHLAGFTPLNGWARFHNPDDAIAFVENNCMDDVTCQVYEQVGSNQTAVDWTTRDRYARNLQHADRVG